MPKRGQYKKNAKADSIRQRKYNSQEEQKKNRAARNAARAEAMQEGKVRKGDDKDVDHKRELSQGGSRSTSNTRVVRRSSNRRSGGRIGGRR